MPIQVKVVSADEYSAWVGEQQKAMAAKADDPSRVWTLEEAVVRGEQVYAANCVACHQATGLGAGAIKPVDGSAIVTGEHAGVINVLLNGAGGGAMPSWKSLSDTEIATAITYIRNNWSNKTGDVVQPSEVAAARQ